MQPVSKTASTPLRRLALHSTTTCSTTASAYGKCILATYMDVQKDTCKEEFEKFGKCMREAVRNMLISLGTWISFIFADTLDEAEMVISDSFQAGESLQSCCIRMRENIMVATSLNNVCWGASCQHHASSSPSPSNPPGILLSSRTSPNRRSLVLCDSPADRLARWASAVRAARSRIRACARTSIFMLCEIWKEVVLGRGSSSSLRLVCCGGGGVGGCLSRWRSGRSLMSTMYSFSFSYDVVVGTSGLVSGSSMGRGWTVGGGIGSGWSGSGVSGGDASTNDVSYAMVMSMNSMKTMEESRQMRKALDGLWAKGAAV